MLHITKRLNTVLCFSRNPEFSDPAFGLHDEGMSSQRGGGGGLLLEKFYHPSPGVAFLRLSGG